MWSDAIGVVISVVIITTKTSTKTKACMNFSLMA
jgi:hypothetical protein